MQNSVSHAAVMLAGGRLTFFLSNVRQKVLMCANVTLHLIG